MTKAELAKKLSLFQGALPATSFLIGFDGFTDEILSCVKTRTDANLFQPFTSIAEFGKRIVEVQGKSTNFELVVKQKKIGGNGPILALALAEMGFTPTLIGALGYPNIEPIFAPLVSKCKKIVSLAPSGHTDAIEFTDGKIMFGKHESILSLGSVILANLKDEVLISLFNETDIFASVNWTMIMEMTELWHHLAVSILPKIQPKTPLRKMFVDLADPAKKSDEKLLKAFNTLNELQKFFTITLGINEREAARIASLFDPTATAILKGSGTQEETLALASFIKEKTVLDTVVIHTKNYAVCASQKGDAIATGDYCERPLLTTGAGDNFNSGFLTGECLHFSLNESLLLGMSCAGFYVRHGKSPTLAELIAFLR